MPISRAARDGQVEHTETMKTLETHLTPSGTTTVPKALRCALGAEQGGRLVWELLPDGTLRVTLKHAYTLRPPLVREASPGSE